MDNRKALMDLFYELKLKGFLEKYEQVVSQVDKNIDDILLELCRFETDRRCNARVKAKIKQAAFPKVKTLAMLSYEVAPKLPRATVENLATCKFIAKKENVVLVGDSGGGKTHLAIALGIEACRHNYAVKFFTACQLVNKLLEEHEQGTIERFLAKIRKYSLCIIDELGYVPFSKKGAELLFQIFSDRYEAGSLIVTSNLPFSRWTEVFIDKTMTTALLDRLTHNATIIKYDWGSIRFNHALQEQQKRTQE